MKTKIILKTLLLSVLFFGCKQSSKPTHSIGLNKDNVQEISKFVLPSNLKFEKREEIDFDNDKQKEVIITASDSSATKQYEFWLKNERLIYEFCYPWASINYKWLVNLDADPENEVIRAQGFEDGVDYAIFDIKKDKQVPILYFNPALEDRAHPGKLFWGYPRDMNNLAINNKMEILSSIDNIQNRDDNHFVPKWQKQLPYLLFHGTTIQPEFTINDIRPFQYRTLFKIQEESKEPLKLTNEITQSKNLNLNPTGLWRTDCTNKKASYLLLNGIKNEGTIEIRDKSGNLVAKMMIEYAPENQLIKYIGMSIIGDVIDSKEMTLFTKGDIIANFNFVEENKISIKWEGLRNSETKKRTLLENPFGVNNPSIIVKCSN